MCHKLISQNCSVTQDWCLLAENLSASWEGNSGPWVQSVTVVSATHRGMWGDLNAIWHSTKTDKARWNYSYSVFPKETAYPLIAFKDKLAFIVCHNYICGALHLLSENSNLTWPELNWRHTRNRQDWREGQSFPALWGTIGFIWGPWPHLLSTEGFCACFYRANVSREHLGREVTHRSVNNAFILSEHWLDG